MLTNQRTYETEYKNYDSSIKVLTKKEINQIKEQAKKERACFENEMEMFYFLAVDWSITIIVVKYLVKKEGF